VRVAVVGASGMLGADLMALLGSEGVGLTHAGVEVCSRESVEAGLPDDVEWVINTAALHDVDGCEADPSRAFAVNAVGALNVASVAAARGAGVVFLSTDYVFDGSSHTPYGEDTAVAPLNVYGVSKVAGELSVRAVTPRHLVVRSAYLFGRRRSGKGWNVVSAIVDHARKRQPLTVATDLVFSPTYTADLARRIVTLLEYKVTGTVHVTNAGACSRLEFTRAVLEATGLDARIIEVKAADLPWRARRPLRSALASPVQERLGFAPMPGWRDAVRRYLEEESVP
jgi:dTDP-4-dehydrorhamnose reductase